METSERTAKRVKFSEDTKDNPTFTPLSTPRSSTIRKTWIKHFCNDEYEQLTKDLTSWQHKNLSLSAFFKKEGEVILDWAISFPSIKPLRFICENIPQELVKDTIIKDNFHIVDKFLLVTAGMESRGLIPPEQLKNRIEKAILLLNLGSEVQEYMSAKSSTVINERLKKGIEVIVKQVLEIFNSKQTKPDFL